MPVEETELTRYDVFMADECFLTGTAAELVPVVRVDSRLIGDGKPGPMTRACWKRFRHLTGSTGTPIFEERQAARSCSIVQSKEPALTERWRSKRSR